MGEIPTRQRSFQSVAVGTVSRMLAEQLPDVKGSARDSASKQAVTRVNVEQASKRVMRKPTPLNLEEGRSHWIRRTTIASSGSAGVVTMACLQKESVCNTGSLIGQFGLASEQRWCREARNPV